MLEWVRYNPSDLKERIRERVKRLKDRGHIDAETARELTARYTGLMEASTYLEPPRAV